MLVLDAQLDKWYIFCKRYLQNFEIVFKNRTVFIRKKILERTLYKGKKLLYDRCYIPGSLQFLRCVKVFTPLPANVLTLHWFILYLLCPYLL